MDHTSGFYSTSTTSENKPHRQQTKEVKIPPRLFTQIRILTLLNQGRIGLTEEREG